MLGPSTNRRAPFLLPRDVNARESQERKRKLEADPRRPLLLSRLLPQTCAGAINAAVKILTNGNGK